MTRSLYTSVSSQDADVHNALRRGLSHEEVVEGILSGDLNQVSDISTFFHEPISGMALNRPQKRDFNVTAEGD